MLSLRAVLKERLHEKGGLLERGLIFMIVYFF